MTDIPTKVSETNAQDEIPDLIKRLRKCASGMGVRDPHDYTSGLSVAEALEAADALADYDKVRHKNKVLVAVLKKQDAEIKRLKREIVALKEAYQELGKPVLKLAPDVRLRLSKGTTRLIWSADK